MNLDGRFKRETANRIARSIKINYQKDMFNSIKRTRTNSRRWSSITSHWKIDDALFIKLISSRMADGLILIISEIFSELTKKIMSTQYIGPARAAARRFYRIQDIAVDEIDPFGDNLALYLSSLSEIEMESFKNWCIDKLGVEFSVESSTGHVSLKIRDRNQGQIFDLADVGFGYSQMLPILAQLWSMENKRSSSFNSSNGNSSKDVLIMEQPELHLHPKMQSVLMDIISSTVLNMIRNGKSPSIIIETHSETMINRLGELIFDDLFDKEFAGVYVFEKDLNNQTIVKNSLFSKDGRLTNWPIGFFSADNF